MTTASGNTRGPDLHGLGWPTGIAWYRGFPSGRTAERYCRLPDMDTGAAAFGVLPPVPGRYSRRALPAVGGSPPDHAPPRVMGWSGTGPAVPQDRGTLRAVDVPLLRLPPHSSSPILEAAAR